MSKLSWHDRKHGNSGMHLVLNRKQFSRVYPIQFSAQTSTLHVKKGGSADGNNTVTIERKKFSKVYGVFRVLYSSSRLFSIIFMFLMRR